MRENKKRQEIAERGHGRACNCCDGINSACCYHRFAFGLKVLPIMDAALQGSFPEIGLGLEL